MTTTDRDSSTFYYLCLVYNAYYQRMKCNATIAQLLSSCFTPNQLVRTRLNVVCCFGKYMECIAHRGARLVRARSAEADTSLRPGRVRRAA